METKEEPEAKLGRPLKVIDWTTVASMAAIHCTGPEIATVLNVDEDTLTAACKREHGMLFSEYIRQKRGTGKASLRRMQWKAAEAGDRTMLVWLGKNWLKQSDKIEQRIGDLGAIGPVIIPDNGRDND